MQNIKKKFLTQIPKHLQRMTHPSLNFAGLLCNFESLLFCFLLKARCQAWHASFSLDHVLQERWSWLFGQLVVCFQLLSHISCICLTFSIMFELSPLAQSHWLEKGVCGIWSGQPSALWAGRCFQLTTWAPEHLPRSLVTEQSLTGLVLEKVKSKSKSAGQTHPFTLLTIPLFPGLKNQKQERNHAGEWSVTRMGRPRWVSRVPRHESGQAGRMPSTAALCVSDRPRPALEFGPRTSEKSFACNLWRLIGLRAALSWALNFPIPLPK